MLAVIVVSLFLEERELLGLALDGLQAQFEVTEFQLDFLVDIVVGLRHDPSVLVDNASEKELLKLILHVKLPDAKLANCEPGRLLPRPLNYHHFRHPTHPLRTLGAARLAAEVAE